MALLVFNALGFQLVWWGWALGAPRGEWGVPTVLSLAFLLAHARFAHRSDPARRRADLRCVLACVVVGAAADTALMQMGWLHFALPNPAPLDGVQPLWMLLLWACMGCTFHHSLAWLRQWPRLALPLSGAFGWLAYDAAAWWGALSRDGGALSALALFVFWALFVPGVQRWSARHATA